MNRTLLLDEVKIQEIEKYYASYKVSNTTPYQRSCFKLKTCSISIYLSKKVVFQGNNIEDDLARWDINATISTNEKRSLVYPKEIFPQCGSDEVGTGDYFGPVCVCVAYIDNEILSALQAFNINDSKAIDDSYILEHTSKLMSIVPHSLLILDNQKYNQIQKTNNLNQIKAKLHNQGYLNLSKRLTMPHFNIVDEFTPKKSYFNYLKDENEVFSDLLFFQKAEAHFKAVAIASMIARYAFLKKMEEMNQKYTFNFPKGAGGHVNLKIKEFVTKYGEEELKNVAKYHFKNTDTLKESPF